MSLPGPILNAARALVANTSQDAASCARPPATAGPAAPASPVATPGVTDGGGTLPPREGAVEVWEGTVLPAATSAVLADSLAFVFAATMFIICVCQASEAMGWAEADEPALRGGAAAPPKAERCGDFNVGPVCCRNGAGMAPTLGNATEE